MPNTTYFAQYQSPNIIIVPTVTFCPPPSGTEQIADPNTNSPTSPTLNCDQLTPVKDNIGDTSASPCRSNCDQQNLRATSSNASTSTEFSDNSKNSLCVIQNTTSTEAPAFNMSQSINDLSTSKYKSRNNLVDLTGFNLVKRERDSTSSLLKRKDLRQIDDTKIEQDKMKTSYDENKHQICSDKDNYKTDNITKESTTSEKPTSTHSEGKTEYLANGEPKENKTDMEGMMKKYFRLLPKENKTGMEGKMKKYFRKLWKRNLEKLRDKATKEKHGKAIKISSKTRQEYKDSKQESRRSKANLQKVSKSNSTKDLKNKIIDSSKKYHDLERIFRAKYHLPDSKVSINRKIDLSPDLNRRYKDFQHFIRHNDDHEIKYKSGNHIKTENLPRKKIQMKSCETTTNKPVIQKKVDERKQSIKTVKLSKVNTHQTNLERVENHTDIEKAIDQSNTDRVKLIKSVVRVDKNVHNNLSQSKRVRSCTPDGVQDLRSRLSRKRKKSEYFVHCHEPMEKRLDQESLMITVKQDVKADSKNSQILASTVNKLKPKKCKKIKLVINIECPNSDSDSNQDFNECCSPVDLSFLDDFNIDEVVGLLNHSQVEPNKAIKTYDKQIKPKEDLINNANMEALKITKKEKEETSSHDGQPIELNSDTEVVDMNIEIGSVANTNKCKNEQNMDGNSKVDRNTKKEANNITVLTKNGYEENAPKEIMDRSKDEQKIKTNSEIEKNNYQEAHNETDLNGKYCHGNAPKKTDKNEQYTTSKNLKLIKPIQTSTLAKKVNLGKKKLKLSNKSNKPSINKITALENTNKKSHNTQHEDKIARITVKQKSTNITDKKQTQLQKSEDPIEASLQKMFNIEQNTYVNSIGVKSDMIKQLSTLDKYVEKKTYNSNNSEASLETTFNNFEQKRSIRKHIDGCDKKVKENSIRKSVDAVEMSLETIFNGTKQQDTGIHMDIEQPSSSQNIQQEIDVIQTAQVMIKIPLETIRNIIEQNKNLNEIKIELSNVIDKHIKIKSESQVPVNKILPETTKNGIEQNAEFKINSESLNVSVIKENRSQKTGSISKKSLETEESILEKAINKMDIIPLCRSSKNVTEHLQTFEDTVDKLKHKPIYNIEKNTNNVICSPPSKNELLLDSGNSIKGTLETEKSFAENCLSSPQIDISSQSSLGQNNKPKGGPLQKSVETIKTFSKSTIDDGEQNTNIRSESNKSVKNIEEKTLLPLENSEVKSEKSPEIELTNSDNNTEVTSEKTSITKAEKSLTATNTVSSLTSSNVENQTKSETVKNNTQKLDTIDDALSDLNKITIKDSELGKRSEIATNTKTKQEQVVSNKSLVPNKPAEIFTTGMKSFLSQLESRMSEYLQKKYTFWSVIHNGRFSTTYKCVGTNGETYAVKAVKQRQTGIFMEEMLFLLQQNRLRQHSFVLYLIGGFEVQNQWCLVTEYYPKNLKQALHGYTRGFHIDQVQILSRQLVDAVNMLTKAGVIHSDIKPTHILLNNANDRMKLCGFDRSNYSNCLNIIPNSGTSSYRAPEVILGFQGGPKGKIDVWSTALVMFEMATNKPLFMTGSNNEILYQQLCTFGSFNRSMLEQSRNRALYFSDTSFIRVFRYNNAEKVIAVHSLQRNDNLRTTLLQSYERQWAQGRNQWQMTRDMDKLRSLHTLLEQMLVLDPRNRLPIQYVGASEFMNRVF